MQYNVNKRNVTLLSMLVLAVATFLITLFVNQEVEAMPSNDVTHVYFYDKARTQYAGEEWVMTCEGAPPGGALMVDGVRAPYYVVISEPCDGRTRSVACKKCEGGSMKPFPVLPRCTPPGPIGVYCGPHPIP